MNNNIKTVWRFLLVIILFIIGTMYSPIMAASAMSGQYTGLKLPYADGQSRIVNRGGNQHGSGRHAIDFKMKYENVSAILGGTAERREGLPDEGNVLYINHGDFCSVYFHLDSYKVNTGDKVEQGQVVAVSGCTGNACNKVNNDSFYGNPKNNPNAHLHLAMIKKSNNRCNAIQANEIAMIFDEKRSGELIRNDNIRSQNTEPHAQNIDPDILATTFIDSGVWNSAYGTTGDLFFTGDFDGNGYGDFISATSRLNLSNNPAIKDLAWYVMKSNGTAFIDLGRVQDSWGVVDDKYFIGDFNGDGKDDIICATPRLNLDNNPDTNDLAWFALLSNGTTFVGAGRIADSWGMAEDKYFVGDFDGDKKADIISATTRLNLSHNPAIKDLAWYVMVSNGTKFVDAGRVTDSWGLDEDKYFVGDFNADGKADILAGLSRLNLDNNPSIKDMAWYIINSNGTTFVGIDRVADSWGTDDDRYFVADFDGDKKADLLDATTRINNDGSLTWYVATLNDNQKFIGKGVWANQWGLSDDVILINNYRKSNNTNTKNFDVLLGRVVSDAYKWWVMYADK